MTALLLILPLEVRVTDHSTVNLIDPCQRKEIKESVIDFDSYSGNDCSYPTACTWSPTCPYESSNLNGDIPTPSIVKHMERIGKCVGLSFCAGLRARGRNSLRSRRITSLPP